jgi:hypothetical protein
MMIILGTKRHYAPPSRAAPSQLLLLGGLNAAQSCYCNCPPPDAPSQYTERATALQCILLAQPLVRQAANRFTVHCNLTHIQQSFYFCFKNEVIKSKANWR